MSCLDRALAAALLLSASFQLQAQDNPPKKYPWDHRLPKCFMPIPDAPPGYVPFGCAKPVDWPSHGETKQRVDNLLTMADYDLLQRAEDELGFSRERFADGQYRFDAWISSLDPFFRAWGARGKAIAEAWAREKGRDGYGTYVLALATYAEGWSVRGHGTANTVTPEAWTIFYRKLEEANALLDGASPKLKAMGSWHELKLRIASEHPKLREGAPALLEAASAAWPEYQRLYTTAMTYASPAWRGNFERMDEVARLAVERNGGKAAMYALVYERYLRFHAMLGGHYALKEMAVDWDLMKRGFREVEAGPAGPQFMAGNFARLACQMRDRQETLRLYRLADGNNPATTAQSSDPCRVFAAVALNAKEWACTKVTTLPAVLDGCEGERCEKANNEIRKDVVLYEKPDRKSKVVGRLKSGQTLDDHQQKTLVVQAGKLTVPDDPESEDVKELKKQGVKAGDVVVGLQYLGEGTHRVCVGDKLFDMNGFEQNESPRTEAWSFVRSRNGSGWAPGVNWYTMMGE